MQPLYVVLAITVAAGVGFEAGRRVERVTVQASVAPPAAQPQPEPAAQPQPERAPHLPRITPPQRIPFPTRHL